MKKVIWFEKLGFLEIIFLLVRGKFSKIEIHYDEHQISPFNLRFVNRLNQSKRCDFFFYPAQLSLNKKDSDGSALMYHVHENLDRCLEAFCKQYLLKEADWFKKMTKCYLADMLLHAVTFITMVESRMIDLSYGEHELVIIRHPTNVLIIDFYQNKGICIKQSLAIKWYLKTYKPIFMFAKILFYQFFCHKTKTSIDAIGPAIWVEYHFAEATNRRLNTWTDHVKANGFDMVYYMDRHDSPVSKEAISTCEKYQFKWVDIINLYKSAHLCFNDYVEIIIAVFRLDLSKPAWFYWYKLHFLVLLKSFCSIYNHFQVKLLFQHRSVSWIQGIQARALELSGGIMLGYSWSNYIWDLETIALTPQHVYFVWGKSNFDYIQNKGLTSKYIVPSGLLVTTACASDEIDSFCKNLDLSFSFFDSSVAYNIHQSPETLSEFYVTMLNLLESNPKWGGIVKSKNMDIDSFSVLPDGATIVSKMTRLVDQKKLLVCDPWVSPLTVAAYTDLTICYSINSAGIIAALCGSRVVHWDCSGWLLYPIYHDKDQQVVYSSLPDLLEAVLNAAAGRKNIGDFSPWRKCHNYFDDCLGPQRMGAFVQSFMKDVIETKNSEHSLQFAVEKYIKDNKLEADWYTR